MLVSNQFEGFQILGSTAPQGPVKWRDRWTLPEAHLHCHSKASPSRDGKRRPGSVYTGRLEMRELEGLNTLIGSWAAADLQPQSVLLCPDPSLGSSDHHVN